MSACSAWSSSSHGRRLLVNELAPRPHNSGHFTFDACVTSQFEQQVRAVCGLPLGSTEHAASGGDGQPARRAVAWWRAGLGGGLSLPDVKLHLVRKVASASRYGRWDISRAWRGRCATLRIASSRPGMHCLSERDVGRVLPPSPRLRRTAIAPKARRLVGPGESVRRCGVRGLRSVRL